MSTLPTVVSDLEQLPVQAAVPKLSEAELDQLVDLSYRSLAENTRLAYRNGVKKFTAWCAAHAPPLAPLPAHPLTVAAFLSAMLSHPLNHKVKTAHVWHAAINKLHEEARLPIPTADPTFKKIWEGLLRLHRSRPRKARPLKVPELREIAAVQQNPPRRTALARERAGTRDRAILLLGFSGAFRRGEIASLRISDLAFDDARGEHGGLTILLGSSKTDQKGEGAIVEIPRGANEVTCPVRATLRWLDVLAEAHDVQPNHPLFHRVDQWGNFFTPKPLAGRSVTRIVQRAARDADVDLEGLSGHSLRSGLATAAAEQGLDITVIMDQTRHRSVVVAMSYIQLRRRGELNAAARIGL